MRIPKMVLEKEKVFMPDGRYLIFYDFKQVTTEQNDSNTKSTNVKKGEGTNNV